MNLPHDNRYFLIALAANMIVEYWLGKTDHVKASSIIELLIDILTAIKDKLSGK